MADKLAVNQARNAFAGLDTDWAYFDNAGGSLTLHKVIERVADYMRTCPVQLGASYEMSQLAAQRQQQAHQAMAKFINASAEEIVFGPSATALLSRLARALGEDLQQGDEVIVTDMDHESNISPWMRLEKQGACLRTWQVNPQTGRLDVEDLKQLLGSRTKLVALSQCSNIFGNVEPIAEFAKIIHAVGAKLCVDGVAYAPHRLTDVTGWDVDYYVVSLYKTFGPHIGLLYGKIELLQKLANINLAHLDRAAVPYKLQPGGSCYELVWGAVGILDYLQELGGTNNRESLNAAFAKINAHENALATQFLEYLNSRKDKIKLYGVNSTNNVDRISIFSFSVNGKTSASIPCLLDNDKLAIRYGNFHSRRLMDVLGLEPTDGVVRVSMAHYNTHNEVDRLINKLDPIVNR